MRTSLRDGRTLSWAEYGDPAGRPVVVLHGTPGSRLQLAPSDDSARDAGVRVIAPDRPGYGGSSPADLSWTDYADDLRQLLDVLDLERVTVSGVSGGGGWALGLGAGAPERVSKVVLVCGMVPGAPREALAGQAKQVGMVFAMSARAPWLVRRLLPRQVEAAATATPEKVARLTRGLPSADVAITTDPARRAEQLADVREALRQGAGAAVAELGRYRREPLGALAGCPVPVEVVHGTDDRNVPVTVARWVTSVLPDATLTELPGEGHLFLADQPHHLLDRVV